MPCNFGIKSYAKIEVPAPQPQVFTTKAEAPKIDAELLTKLGSEDPEFLDWARGLNTKPLLEEALKRALAKVGGKKIDFTVNAKGMLEAKGSYITSAEKKVLSETAARVSERWQFEILGIVTQLLDYRMTIREENGGFVLEAEEEGATHPCDYIKITKNANGAELLFEHFKSRGALELETAKFLTLADRLGVKISVRNNIVTEGDPLPNEVRVDHGHGHTHTHGDGHSHTH